MDTEAHLQHGLETDPENAERRSARGLMLAGIARDLEAPYCFQAAVEQNPNDSAIWCNLGNAMLDAKLANCAIECHRRAIALSPKNGVYHGNLATSLAQLERHGDAIAEFSRALELNPDDHVARLGRARSRLVRGEYALGWPDYEARLKSPFAERKRLPGRTWDGSRQSGRRLLVVMEQDLGDLIWIARYLPHVKARCGELIVECPQALATLIAGIGAADRLIEGGGPLPDADLHCHLRSLPGLLMPVLGTAAAVPYLSPPRDRGTLFARLTNSVGAKLKVGIAWSGGDGPGKGQGEPRTLRRFLEAFVMPRVALFGLEPQERVTELAAPAQATAIADLSPFIVHFGDVAAAIAQLDLVVTSDSPIAHLAGALAKPVWVLLDSPAHWFWLLDRYDSPWYPSMRLFRPHTDGNHDHAFDAAAARLFSLAIE
ncbi:MAG TPA: tetratricopeptide repeat-containing glycosyltransferase family protein [Alphaproteobacteria bacterium]|nr:tetratricopeptide repeat-containing glycosyltransferase family protein [Alphaproteobacteria bacterium]